MPEEKRKIPRLGKAAGEFNISIGTVTALLKKKNLEIEENPNTKLTEEMYDILVKEFSDEKLVKEEADKIDIGTFNSKAKVETKIKSPKAEEKEEQTDEEDLLIKNVNLINPHQHIETESHAPKIIGKIDLEQISPAHKKNSSAQQTVEKEQPITPKTPPVIS